VTRCDACPGTKKCIPPDGYLDAAVWGIGEGPGFDEERLNCVFSGRTGKELRNHYIRLSGIHPSNFLLANAISCMPDTPGGKITLDQDKDRHLLETCSQHNLIPLIKEYRPKLLVLMGAFACHAIDPCIDLELQHGMPVQTPYGTAFVLYHPSVGLHEPKRMLMLRNDWMRLKRYMNGTLRLARDEHPKPIYKEITGRDQLIRTLHDSRQEDMAIDTESTRRREPFCLTYSVKPGTGFLIRASSDVLRVFQRFLNEWRGRIILHNLLYDSRVLKCTGIILPKSKVRCTMLRAFNLGNLPQGLKALAYRELGMTMEDFDDVVTPHSKPIVLDYLREVFTETWPDPDEVLERKADGTFKIKKPQNFRTKLKRFWGDYTKNEAKDPFKAWENWEESWPMVEERCGPFPGKCISHVPFELALTYACRDADATLRLWQREEYMTRRVRRVSQDSWGEES